MIGIAKLYNPCWLRTFPNRRNRGKRRIVEKNRAEFGVTTGRPRRCGWLDIPLLKKPCRLNGVTGLFDKLDILSALDEIPLCVAYKNNKPVYEIMPGWNKDIQGIQDYGFFLKIKYVEHIEKSVKLSIVLLGTGPQRKSTIVRWLLS